MFRHILVPTDGSELSQKAIDGAIDLAVGIRIVACEAGRAFVHAGGAVLLASDPAAEEAESVAKAKALLESARPQESR